MQDKYKQLSTIIGAIDYQINCWRKWLKEFVDLTDKTNEMAETKIKELEESKKEVLKWFNGFNAKSETYIVSDIECQYGYYSQPPNYFATFTILNGVRNICKVPISPELIPNIKDGDSIGVEVKVFKV